MQVTVLTTRLFDAPASGGELCTARLLAALHEAGHQVRLIGRGTLPPWAGPGSASLGPLVPAFDSLSPAKRFFSLLGALAARRASTLHRLCAGNAVASAHRALLAPGLPPPDALVVDHLQAWVWLAPVLHLLPAPMLLMHNLESAGYGALAAQTSGWRRWMLQREAQLLAALERQALRGAAAVACLSDTDHQWLRQQSRKMGSACITEVLPGYPLAGLNGPVNTGPRSPGAGRPGPTGGPRIGLLGTWTWAPNRAALQWMLDAVLPRLPSHCTLVLAGTGLPDGLQGRRTEGVARVECLGRVDSVQRFYSQVDVVAIPSLGGSGVQEKAIEAIALAPAVVASAHALRGLGRDLPAHVRVADDAEAFARLCALASVRAARAPAAGTLAWCVQRQARYQQALDRCLLASAAKQPGGGDTAIPKSACVSPQQAWRRSPAIHGDGPEPTGRSFSTHAAD